MSTRLRPILALLLLILLGAGVLLWRSSPASPTTPGELAASAATPGTATAPAANPDSATPPPLADAAPPATPAPDTPAGTTAVLRERPLPPAAAPFLAQLLNAAGAPPETIIFDLFPDVTFTGLVGAHEKPVAGAVAYRGKLKGEPGGDFALYVEKGVLAGKLSVPRLGREYEIRRQPDAKTYVVREIDVTLVPDCGGAPATPGAALLARVQAHALALATDATTSATDLTDPAPATPDATIAADGDVLIDIMVVYTARARIAEGGTPAINALIGLCVTETNGYLRDSGIAAQLRLVHRAEVTYLESSADMSTDLNWVTDNAGVASLRDNYKADLVALLVDSETSAAGMGWLPRSTGNPRTGFFVTTRAAASRGRTFAHEMGHNLGSNHDAGNAGSGGAFAYSYGHRFTARSQTYRTIMAYSPGTRLGLFSTPQRNFEGTPVGTSTADNARSINQMTSVIAAYRSGTAAPPTGTPTTGPANDAFAASIPVTGASATLSGSNINASKESGEPTHANNAGGRSVWWTWAAPAAGRLVLSTQGSAFDTLLAVYTGSAINALSPVAANDDASGTTTSRVDFAVTAGTIYRIAVDGYGGAAGGLALSLAFTADATGGTPPPTSTAPANDAFSAATALAGASIDVAGSNVGATAQPGEPLHAGRPAARSVWWTWTPAATGSATLSTVGSNFDTLLAVYTGSTLGTLTPVAANDDAGGTASEVTFQAAAGTVYRIAIDGYAGATGTLQLRIRGASGGTTPPPSGHNDAFAAARPLSGSAATDTASSANATRESGEPAHAGDSGGRSVWWSWTAPGTGPVTLHTEGSDFDTLLAVYTGSAVNALSPVAANDDAPDGLWSRVSFTATAGVTYRIAVDGYGGDGGLVSLTLAAGDGGPPPPPPGTNDAFAAATALTGATVSVSSSNTAATKETGEPAHAGSGGGRSLWWTWTAPASGSVTVDTAGSRFDTVLAVYTGSSLGTLTVVAANDDATGSLQSRVTFTATAGTLYRLAVDGYSGASGAVTLNIALSGGGGANDNFEAASVLSGSSADATGSSTAATKQPGEPAHAGDTGGRSLWWTWTAPASGTATLSSAGSAFDTVLAVYTGPSLAGLTPVGANDDFGNALTSRVTFQATAGTVYRFALDGFGGAGGAFTLALRFTPGTTLARPANDDFPQATPLPAAGGTLTALTSSATREPSEPEHAGSLGAHSVWWSWTATQNATVSLSTAGSDFDTLLAVYRGTSLSGLVPVAANDDATDATSALTFEASAGTTYRIAVDGYGGESGRVTLALAVTSAGSVHAGVFTGDFNQRPADGPWALIVRADGRASFLGYARPLERATLVDDFSVAADGTFSVDVPGGGRLAGTISGATVAGAITDLGATLALSATRTEAGAEVARQGYYRANWGDADGVARAIVAPSGQVVALVTATGFTDGFAATLGSGGSLAALNANGHSLTATFSDNLRLTGNVGRTGLPAASLAGTRETEPPVARLVNISTRGFAGTGDRVMIVGFVVSGTEPRQVLIKARGPGLARFGLADVLVDPRLTLYRQGNEAVATNNDWRDGPEAVEIAAMGERPDDDLEPARLLALEPGLYTAVVDSNSSAGTGVAIVELFEVDAAGLRTLARLINLSTRGHVGRGDRVLIAGLVVTGDEPKTILLRGIGRGLEGFGVTDALPDAHLRLVRLEGAEEIPVAANDNWGEQPNAAAIVSAGHTPWHESDAALLLRLPPGVYTAILSGVNDGEGVGLVEAYELSP